jgi:hypothetical protein
MPHRTPFSEEARASASESHVWTIRNPLEKAGSVV